MKIFSVTNIAFENVNDYINYKHFFWGCKILTLFWCSFENIMMVWNPFKRIQPASSTIQNFIINSSRHKIRIRDICDEKSKITKRYELLFENDNDIVNLHP